MHRSGKFFWIIAESTLKPKKRAKRLRFFADKRLMDTITYFRQDINIYKPKKQSKAMQFFKSVKNKPVRQTSSTKAFSACFLPEQDLLNKYIYGFVKPAAPKRKPYRITLKNINKQAVFSVAASIIILAFAIPFSVLRLEPGRAAIKNIDFYTDPAFENAMRQYVMAPSEDAEAEKPFAADDTEIFAPVEFAGYTVKKGDTISGIIIKFGLKNMGTILSVNGISNARRLQPGDRLIIPSMDGIFYTAEKNDNLSAVAAKFNLSVTALLDANDLESQTVNPGQKLFIPGAVISAFDLRKALGELFIYPIKGRLTSPFGYRRDPFTGKRSFHTGIDLAAPKGTPIKAALDGTVSVVGISRIYGNYIIISHGNGYQSMYGHMQSVNVKRGAYLNQGSIIGGVGNSGRSTGPHVHFSLYKNGTLINPLTMLKK